MNNNKYVLTVKINNYEFSKLYSTCSARLQVGLTIRLDKLLSPLFTVRVCAHQEARVWI